MKREHIEKDVVKAFKKANRELEFLRNGGGQWVSKNQTHKNKKKYDRKVMKRELREVI